MIKRTKKFIRALLPARLVQRIQVSIHGVKASDAHAAWEFKRDFFWRAVRMLDFNGIDGDYVEFGCHTAMTFRLAFDQFRQRTMKRHMWAFDSFEGLPQSATLLDSHPEWVKGSMTTNVDAFHKICKEHGIPSDAYTVVQGYYDDTLRPLLDNAPPNNIAFAYIDCDMYSSTRTVLEFLKPRLKHGMVLAFDDYFCFSADQLSGERKAMLDVLSGYEKWKFVRYRDFGWAGASFVVENADLVATSNSQ